MNEVAGKKDILFICLDTLRYDAAKEEEEKGNTPVLNQYGPWQKCQAPGNFTYPSHHAMFAGFLPCPWEARSIADRSMLFFPKNIGMGRMTPPGAFAFEGATIMEGLERIGYDTWCVGGVAFFDKRTELGSVFPGYFKHSFWKPGFGCQVPDSAKNQVDFIQKKLQEADREKRIFLYVNIDAIHYPNWFYLGENASRHDTIESHKAALRCADTQLAVCSTGGERREETLLSYAVLTTAPAMERTAASFTASAIRQWKQCRTSIFSFRRRRREAKERGNAQIRSIYVQLSP